MAANVDNIAISAIFSTVTGAIGASISYYFAKRTARQQALAQSKEQARESRELSLIELQTAFDDMFDNDMARWQTLNDILTFLDGWLLVQYPDTPPMVAVKRALEHLGRHVPKSVHLINPEIWAKLRDGIR